MARIRRIAVTLGALLLSEGTAAVAFASSPAVLSIQVVAADGNPITKAAVRFLSPDEYEDHCVDPFDGSWEGAALYLRGGKDVAGAPAPQEVLLRPGTDVTFLVYADGYAPVTVVASLAKATDLTVTLQAAAPDTYAPYGWSGFCGVDSAQHVDDPKANDRRELTEADCGTTVVLRGTIGLLGLSLPAPTDGSRWTTPFVAPSVLDLGPGSRDGGALKQVYGFRDYGATTLVVDRLAGDGSVAQTCTVHAIMRPMPQ